MAPDNQIDLLSGHKAALLREHPLASTEPGERNNTPEMCYLGDSRVSRSCPDSNLI